MDQLFPVSRDVNKLINKYLNLYEKYAVLIAYGRDVSFNNDYCSADSCNIFMIGCVKYNQLFLLQKFIKEFDIPTESHNYVSGLYDTASKIGDFKMLKYLYNIHCPKNVNVMNNLCLNGDLKIVQWAYEKNFVCDYSPFTHAVASDNIELCKWMYEKNFHYDRNSISIAILTGRLEILKWLFNKKFPYEKSIIKFAVFTGNLEILDYLLQLGFKYTDACFTRFVANGHYHMTMGIAKELYNRAKHYNPKNKTIIFNRLIDSGIDINNSIFESVVIGGELDIVKYFYEEHDNSNNWYSTHLQAIKYDYVDIYMFFEDKPDLTITICDHLNTAIQNDSIKIVKYILNKSKINDYTDRYISSFYCYSISNNNYKILKYLYDYGFPWPDINGIYIYSHTCFDIINFMIINNFIKKHDICSIICKGDLRLIKLIDTELMLECEWDKMIKSAINSNNINVVKYLHTLYDRNTLVDSKNNYCAIAVSNINLSMLKYLHEFGYKLTEECYFNTVDKKIINYLENHNCPYLFLGNQ